MLISIVFGCIAMKNIEVTFSSILTVGAVSTYRLESHGVREVFPLSRSLRSFSSLSGVENWRARS